MRYRHLSVVLCAARLLAQTPAAPALNPPKDWFRHAAERMTLRFPGAAPFHLHARFEAFAGDQLLAPHEKPDFVVGRGEYDEAWIAPHEWRRSVSLGTYHAVEADGGAGRRMVSSSAYEPSRVLMLLGALLSPVPRGFVDRERREGRGWRLDSVRTAGLSLIRASKSFGSHRAEYSDSYYFLPASGALAISNAQGLVTIWSDDIAWGSAVVARHITVKCGDRELLSADITIETATESTYSFSLDAPIAEPGMTLRPLASSDLRVPQFRFDAGFSGAQLGAGKAFSITGMLDREGHIRELEVLTAEDRKSAAAIMAALRQSRQKAATIDGSPCEYRVVFSVL